jgi:transcriptional regulator with XRE-family HTH domain
MCPFRAVLFHRDMTNRAGADLRVVEADVTASRIGARVQQLRVAADWSTREFAQRVGIAPTVAANIEDGLRLPTIELLYRLAGALHVAPGELLPSPDDRPRAEVVLPITDAHDAPTAQVIGGGPGNPTQTYLFDLPAGEGDGGFGRHPGDELIVVIEGEVVCSTLDRPDELVRAGRSHVIETHLPHGLRAGDSGPARFLLVCTDACDHAAARDD